MTRTQISMDREMLRRARVKATERGVSFAEYVRTLVRSDLGGEESPADVGGLFDLFDSGRADIAVEKDRMIAEAIAHVPAE